MKSRQISQVVIQDNAQVCPQLPLTLEQKKCVSPMTFSQKLYKSLSETKNYLDKLFELSD